MLQDRIRRHPKIGFFEPSNILALHECHPLLLHLICTCVHLRHHDFSWLAEYDTAWSTQDTLRDDKAYTFLACLIHYNLSVANTIWFLGNNYTGEYHDIPLQTENTLTLPIHSRTDRV
jgi:hypothetical protein